MITNLLVMISWSECASKVDVIVLVEILTQLLSTDSVFQGIPKIFGFSRIIRRRSSISKIVHYFQLSLLLSLV